MVDYRQADLSKEERLLCDFAIKLTLAPANMRESDVGKLRASGFTDEQITIATQVVAYFNYINRVADGLGVDDEDWMTNVSREDWDSRRGTDYLDTITK